MTPLVVQLQNAYAQLWDREHGQTMSEYALILGGVALVALVGVIFLGGCTNARFQSTGSSVQDFESP